MFLIPQRILATQWHKRILSDFSLELEDRTTFSYQGCISRASAGKWIGYFPSERQSWQGEKEKKLIGLLQFPWVDFLRGESFWSLSHPVLLQPDSQTSLGQGADPQAGWGMTDSWRSNPRAGWGVMASRELGSWAGRGVTISWDPWTGGSPSRLRRDNLSRARSLGRSRQVDLLGPPDWSWASPRSPAWPLLGRINGL